MSSTLGEKLRQAREERGISISEVAEQTRISSLYLEAIEKDDYKTLPGGIFNKGFVRSYAKYVGIDEQEALQDYSKIVVENEDKEEERNLSYRPEVLTDDRPGSSLIPTVIFAVIILGMMTGGILFLVNYIQNQQNEPAVVANTANIGPDTNIGAVAEPMPIQASAPAMESLKVEFQAVGDAVSLISVTDGKNSEALISPGNPVTFEPKKSLTLRYSRARAQFAQLRINGKEITLPTVPGNPKRSNIEFEINSGNVAQIWQSGEIVLGGLQTAVEPSETANETPVSAPAAETRSTPASAPPAEMRSTPASTPAEETRTTPTPRSTPRPVPTSTVRIGTPIPTATPIVVGRPRTVPTPRRSPN